MHNLTIRRLSSTLARPQLYRPFSTVLNSSNAVTSSATAIAARQSRCLSTSKLALQPGSAGGSPAHPGTTTGNKHGFFKLISVDPENYTVLFALGAVFATAGFLIGRKLVMNSPDEHIQVHERPWEAKGQTDDNKLLYPYKYIPQGAEAEVSKEPTAAPSLINETAYVVSKKQKQAI